MDDPSELVDKDVILKLKNFVQHYGVIRDYDLGTMQAIEVSTSDCIIQFYTWFDKQTFFIRVDTNTLIFHDLVPGHYLTEDVTYYNEKMNHDACVVCAKSDMTAEEKIEFISVAMALFGAKDGKFTKKAT